MHAEITVEVHEELRPLLPGFLDNRQRDLKQLAQCLASADYAAIERIAHNMKGVGAGYGFDQVTTLGEQLEQAARQRDRQATAACVAEFEEFLRHYRVVFV